MTTSMKLTKAQRELLEDLGERTTSRMHISEGYKPIVRLHELGLVDKKEHRLGNPSFAITDLGRAAISGGTNG